MNLFKLFEENKHSAEGMADMHVINQPRETAQMLATAHRELDGEEFICEGVYKHYRDRETTKFKKPRKLKILKHMGERVDRNGFAHMNLYMSSHVNHPTTKWVRENKLNYFDAVDHLLELGYEYQFRYQMDRTHKAISVIQDILDHAPNGINDADVRTPLPLVMPDEFKEYGITTATKYREFYKHKILHTVKKPPLWTRRKPPAFMHGSKIFYRDSKTTDAYLYV